jgi:Type IV secretion-system coupling protein DNA-binding domain
MDQLDLWWQRGLYRLGMWTGMGLRQLFTRTVIAQNKLTSVPQTTAKDAEKEKRRFADCRTVVLSFLNTQGYIARECISREELEEKIDSGIEPEELAQEIYNRIQQKPGVILGLQPIGNQFEIKLPYSLRQRHVYIIGKSGSGKANLLRNMILQDLSFGNGIGVLAPELVLLTEEILPYIPENRIDDVVFVNPADTAYPVPFNPLHLDEGEDIDLKVDDAVTIFKRLMGETGARMDEILRQSFYALMQRPGSTLLDIEPLLNPQDSTLRDEIIRTSDEQTARFFRSTYPSYPKDAHIPITTRISRLIRPKVVRTLLCQPGRSFNYRQAMDEGKILIVNVSDGVLGEQTSQLLGQLIISKIQMAVMSRVDTPAAARRPFYLYLDEFQTFTGVAETSYDKILSRARKYRLSITLAHQQTGQLSQDLLREILGNVATILTFAVSHTDAQKLSPEYVWDVGSETDPFPPVELQRSKVGEAWAKLDKTILPLRTYLAPQQPDFERATQVILRSRKNYANGAVWEKPPTPPDQKLLPQKPPDDEPPIDPSQVF